MTYEHNARSSAQAIVDDYYERFYSDVHSAGCLSGAAKAQHLKLEHGRKKKYFPVTLELGCGSFQHLPYVVHRKETYVAMDMRYGPAVKGLARRSVGDNDFQLGFIQADATNLPIGSHTVDRVVATCLALHLHDPFSALLEWQRVCKPKGVIDFLVPCEAGLTLRAFRRLFSERTAIRQGVTRETYRLVNAVDHVSSFPRMLAITRAALSSDRKLTVRYYPLRRPKSWYLNAFTVFTIEPREP
jgi:ubiquinone/menaquinone biosynthesis C-methylase UbiE